ncbi:ABC-2 type transport system ATP-binding protein [Paenibacillus phyllosphaerae]|uniref:ABC-2 type transport system ATP-binding protein n=1 Tax=Paenibacillus phyllosphaerae TaxID=274593 RepID=A0A7W5FPC1_9BACL|nr:ABC transporter ATP-binding protein [Paenibacillus phyllosphaerae]MBB3111884.1 ABC-2 type transport system ATP-binding protein [Paenibacillus phyllosphaerae]
MTVAAIEARGLTKQYDNGRGCRDVTIQVGKGEAFGFLGPNGAGKSTFVKMLVGLITPTSGTANLLGEPIGTLASKRLIGYLPELYRYQEWLSGEEVVRLHAKLCGVDRSVARHRIPQLLEEVGIGRRGSDRVKHYSKGMQQRLGLACALVGDPPIVFLDEPSSALDPIGRREVRRILERLKAQGKTIFLNSHLLEDVEALCDRMALLNNGQILRHGQVSEVLQTRTRWRFKVGGFTPFLLSWLNDTTGLAITLAEGAAASAGAASGLSACWLEAELEDEEQVGWINSLIVQQGMTLYEVTSVRERLEEWFMNAVSGLEHRGERG